LSQFYNSVNERQPVLVTSAALLLSIKPPMAHIRQPFNSFAVRITLDWVLYNLPSSDQLDLEGRQVHNLFDDAYARGPPITTSRCVSPLTSHFSLLTSHGRASGLPRVVLLLQLHLNLVADGLDLPPFPLPSPDQIAKEKPLQDWNQRH
jgi:hypothetical protein